MSKVRLFNNDIDDFLLLLRKSVYPYEFMNDCEKFFKNLIAWIRRILK